MSTVDALTPPQTGTAIYILTPLNRPASAAPEDLEVEAVVQLGWRNAAVLLLAAPGVVAATSFGPGPSLGAAWLVVLERRRDTVQQQLLALTISPPN